MKRIQVVGARSYFYCVAIVESGHGISDLTQSVRKEAVRMLSQAEHSKEFIEVSPFDFETDDMDVYDSMVFFSCDGGTSDSPSDWVQRFINDYFPRWESDYTLQWKIALESYTRDIEFFEDAFDHPSEFPPVDGYEVSEYEVMRFLIDTYDKCSKSTADDSDRNRRNYYFLRYPRLRGAVMKYRQSFEGS